MRKIIGLIPLYDDERTSYWMLPGYMKMIEDLGGFPVMLPLTTDQKELSQVLYICDGIIFTGGQDIEPALYHTRKSDEKSKKLIQAFIGAC
ncbi:MAG: gamma-glutamyl-gamma-aminobutyrate hydrolase family protein [Lachnospiraceae bacterium]|nr:gamma-glutamyl-gamma-aminobutyrate hydrolase family protein [Lachnospiraceae bacterium]